MVLVLLYTKDHTILFSPEICTGVRVSGGRLLWLCNPTLPLGNSAARTSRGYFHREAYQGLPRRYLAGPSNPEPRAAHKHISEPNLIFIASSKISEEVPQAFVQKEK